MRDIFEHFQRLRKPFTQNTLQSTYKSTAIANAATISFPTTDVLTTPGAGNGLILSLGSSGAGIGGEPGASKARLSQTNERRSVEDVGRAHGSKNREGGKPG